MLKLLMLLFVFPFQLSAATLVLVGGGDHPPEALEYFLSKLKTGPIYVLPWGTSYPEESFIDIKRELDNLGAADVRCFCEEELTQENVDELAHAGGLYFPGGDQNKIMQKILKTKTKPLIKTLYDRGVPIAGTSAGTAIQTNPMLTGSGSLTSEGLGLLQNFIVDQHFLVRNREGRLLEALKKNPTLNGMGIDENMSAVIEDSKIITALGPSLVTLYLRIGNQLKKKQLAHLQALQIH